MTTVAEVLAWNPDAVTTAGTEVSTAADTLLDRVRDLESAADTLSDGWQGVAADAAHRAVVSQRDTGKDLVAALDAVSSALETGATSIATARSSLIWIRDDDAGRGYQVMDDGSVVPPPIQPVLYAPEDAARVQAELDRERTAREEEARHIAGEVGRAVDDAVLADHTLAEALRTVELPQDLRTTVEEIRRRHDAGEDTWDILGSLGFVGGAAVTVKALLGVWKAGTKLSALASFYGNAVRGGLAYGQAVRWLTTGAGDASAFLRAVRAAEGLETAAGVFQFGKTPTWLVGARTAAGKAFLPLTIATGTMDAITGGGYDGSRGTATRVLGGAGAAGAAGLLGGAAMYGGAAAFMASNPVGWGIAATAVTAYTLWTAGNFVYDHWDDISDFAGSAASWVGDRGADIGNAVDSATDWAGDRLSGAADTAGDMLSGAASGLGGALDKVGIF
ncbi:WXG100 family type VII secretion target [Phycicoccus sp. CSK15P-2]|uniref:WXG100 family type VII secretion target n=1 Tax=Phycicoccus sp. CSK15P-2 TaxID=2807627 RepID=UPI001950D98B|nr:WXG100 family type VII secretion target [Phycicoccus sp. CSK15P-2]MBM6403464.1 WXG100 family type VII secretion target [Phycicoccus sp. CSK15P-2]